MRRVPNARAKGREEGEGGQNVLMSSQGVRGYLHYRLAVCSTVVVTENEMPA